VWREQGVEGLRKRKASGRPSRLDKSGQAQLLEALRKGAKAHEFPDERWTLPRIAEVLNKALGVSYDPDYLSVVMRKLGWSVQRAQPKAVERNEQAIKTWLETTLPEVLKRGN
jgi:putative transposase